jgi:hypothetical protein
MFSARHRARRATEDGMPIREIINLILDRPIVEILLFLSVSALPIGVLWFFID